MTVTEFWTSDRRVGLAMAKLTIKAQRDTTAAHAARKRAAAADSDEQRREADMLDEIVRGYDESINAIEATIAYFDGVK